MDGFLEMVKIIALIVEIRNFNPNKITMKTFRNVPKKNKCTGCIYDEYKVWRDANYDPCYICDKYGSEKVLTQTKQ